MNASRTRLRVLAAFLCLVGMVACGGSNGDGDPAAPVVVEGEAFTDPQGSYVLTVPERWSRASGRNPEAEGWAVAPKKDGFTANVSILSDGDPGATTVAQYMDDSFADLTGLPGFAVLDQDVVAGSDGQELGVVWYTASISPGAAPILFLSYTALQSGKAVDRDAHRPSGVVREDSPRGRAVSPHPAGHLNVRMPRTGAATRGCDHRRRAPGGDRLWRRRPGSDSVPAQSRRRAGVLDAPKTVQLAAGLRRM